MPITIDPDAKIRVLLLVNRSFPYRSTTRVQANPRQLLYIHPLALASNDNRAERKGISNIRDRLSVAQLALLRSKSGCSVSTGAHPN